MSDTIERLERAFQQIGAKALEEDPAPTRIVITPVANGYLVDEDGALAVFEAPDDEYGDHRAVRALVYHLWPELTGKRGMRILLPGEE